MGVMTWLLSRKHEHQHNVNDFGSSISDYEHAVQQHLAIIELLATILGKNGIDNITNTS
jgi:hypothetical protein